MGFYCRDIRLSISVQTGAKKGKKVASSTKQGFGEKVVLQMTECLASIFSFDLFMDNYFRSFCLLTYLGVNNI